LTEKNGKSQKAKDATASGIRRDIKDIGQKHFVSKFPLGFQIFIQHLFEDSNLSIEKTLPSELFSKVEHRYADDVFLLNNDTILYVEYVTNYNLNCLKDVFLKTSMLYHAYQKDLYVLIIHFPPKRKVRKPVIKTHSFSFTPKHYFLANIDSKKVILEIENKFSQGDKEIDYELLQTLFVTLSKKNTDQLSYITDTFRLIENKLDETKIDEWLRSIIFITKKPLDEIAKFFNKKGVKMPDELEQSFVLSSSVHKKAVSALTKEKEEKEELAKK
jgi:hypothetical protein